MVIIALAANGGRWVILLAIFSLRGQAWGALVQTAKNSLPVVGFNDNGHCFVDAINAEPDPPIWQSAAKRLRLRTKPDQIDTIQDNQPCIKNKISARRIVP